MKNYRKASSADILKGTVLIAMIFVGSVAAFSQNTQAVQLFKEYLRVDDINYKSLSPDGRALAYSVKRSNAEERSQTLELFVQNLNPNGSARGNALLLATEKVGEGVSEFFDLEWEPAGDYLNILYGPNRKISMSPSISQGQRMRYQVATGRISVEAIPELLPVKDLGYKSGQDARPLITSLPRKTRTIESPSGRYLAFTAVVKPGSKTPPEGGVLLTPEMLRGKLDFSVEARNGLFVFDKTTGNVRQLTPDNLYVGEPAFSPSPVSWSPDERQIAFSGFSATDKFNPHYCDEVSKNDIFSIDVATGVYRKLVDQPGEDRVGKWSPDGKWIAFVGEFEASFRRLEIALVPAAGGSVLRLPGVGGSYRWSSDSQSLLYKLDRRMGERLGKVDIQTRKTTILLDSDERTSLNMLDIPGGLNRVSFLRQSYISPSEVWIGDLRNGTEFKVASVATPNRFSEQLRKDRMSWKSGDGKFTVEGILLTPKSTWNEAGTQLKMRLPTLIFNLGGPSMVRDKFSDNLIGYGVVMAAYGYAVLIPNTRGRGGYGEAFADGMATDGPGYGKGPYDDVISGVDFLIAKGIADPSKLGIYGHSFGGYLTSYALTRTDRFNAGINFEGPVDLGPGAVTRHSGGTQGCMQREWWGVRNPYEPSELSVLIEQTPSFNTHKVKTPLLMFGGKGSVGVDVGVAMEAGLRMRSVPAEFVLYDDGHAFSKLSNHFDGLGRIVEWFDYWVRGIATERMAKRYGPPKNADNTATAAKPQQK